eukprot:scaffold90982_cov75-Phaeocystis_antarctica.AAC.1
MATFTVTASSLGGQFSQLLSLRAASTAPLEALEWLHRRLPASEPSALSGQKAVGPTAACQLH